MCVPIILPLQITLLLLVVIASGLALYLRRRGYPPGRTFLWTSLACGAASLPLCAGVGAVVDAVRYGEFHYERASEITDVYIDVPPTATDITVHRYATGHYARFRVSEPELVRWLEQLRKDGLPFPEGRDEEVQGPSDLICQTCGRNFEQVDWKCPADVKEFLGPRASDGAGFDVWHSAEGNIAFQRAGYW